MRIWWPYTLSYLAEPPTHPNALLTSLRDPQFTMTSTKNSFMAYRPIMIGSDDQRNRIQDANHVVVLLNKCLLLAMGWLVI